MGLWDDLVSGITNKSSAQQFATEFNKAAAGGFTREEFDALCDLADKFPPANNITLYSMGSQAAGLITAIVQRDWETFKFLADMGR